MKLKAAFFSALFICSTGSAYVSAKASSELFVVDGKEMTGVAQLLSEGTDIQSTYGVENFCYQGNADAVLIKIAKYKKSGEFFSGGGGGLEYISGQVLRGFVTYDLQLKFADEVADGETQTVIVKPCSSVIK